MTLLLDLVDPLEELILTPDTSLRWSNAHGNGGSIVSWLAVRDLIDLVGSKEEWTFLIVNAGDGGRFAQCCGRPAIGYAVEAGDHRSSALVAPQGSSTRPTVLVTQQHWTYHAATTELHPAETVANLFEEWVVHGTLPPGHVFHRLPAGRGWRNQQPMRLPY